MMKLINPKNNFCLTPIALLISAALTGQAFAQEQAPDAAGVERIEITTQKRVQAIQDVPVTVSALDADVMEDLGVDRFDELSDLIPGLVVQQQSINNNGYVIRGITSDDGASESAARVSIYLNGTDVSRSRASYFEVYDMERVEVVKGPQATLFGTAASIGAISFITAKPQQEFESKVAVAAGNYGMTEIEGFVTGGNELVQARLALVKKDRDGYVKNQSEEGDLNGYDRLAIRPSLRITPNEQLTIDLVYNYDEANDPGTAFVSEDVLFTDNASLSVPDDTSLGLDDVGIEREVSDFNATVNWDIDNNYSLTYTGAYRDYDSLEAFDADGTEYEFLNFAEQADGDQSSHELRLNYAGEKLNGFVGVSYFQEDANQLVPFAGEEGLYFSCLGLLSSYGVESCYADTTYVLTGGLYTEIPYESYYSNSANNSSVSLFADASYWLSDKLELTAGVRLVQEDRESTYMSNLPDSTLLALALGMSTDVFFGASYNTSGEEITGDTDDTVLLPRVNLLYKYSPQMNVYATIAKGQRSEVLDMSSGTAELIPAEEVLNYEVGIKGNNDSNTLSYTLATFYQDYENFQVNVVDAETGLSVTENAGSATNIGVEADVRWSVNDNLSFMANAAYIDAGIDDDSSNGTYAGNQFRLQPEWTGAVSYIYQKPLTEGLQLTSSGSWSYRSSHYFDIANTYEEGAVDLLNLRVGIAAADNNWEVNLSATNVLDEEYIMDAGNTGSAFGYATYIEGAPRMYSISFTKRFGLF